MSSSNTHDWTYQDILDYLADLDASDSDVSDWEAEFIASLMKQSEQPGFTGFSIGQRNKISEIVSKYGDEL